MKGLHIHFEGDLEILWYGGDAVEAFFDAVSLADIGYALITDADTGEKIAEYD